MTPEKRFIDNQATRSRLDIIFQLLTDEVLWAVVRLLRTLYIVSMQPNLIRIMLPYRKKNKYRENVSH